MERLADDTIESFMNAIEERLAEGQKNKIPFSRFLEEKMDAFDYSNTSLAKKVFHRVEKKKEGTVSYVPVTRQAIGAWLRGSMPSSRDIYVTLGMAFEMNLEEINHILLETYMGYGLYCKNIDDALWIALINGLFPIDAFEDVRAHIEDILEVNIQQESRSLATMDLWVMLSEVKTLEEFYELIRSYKDEFKDGTRKFGQCLEEVIEEEYGYYDKAAWFLRDIGCLHWEAQFSKIRAGKAVVTREWLLVYLPLQNGSSRSSHTQILYSFHFLRFVCRYRRKTTISVQLEVHKQNYIYGINLPQFHSPSDEVSLQPIQS